MYVGGMTSTQMPQRSPVRAGGDPVALPPVQTPVTYQPPAPVQSGNQMTASSFFAGLMDGIANMFKSVVAFFKNLFGGNSSTTSAPLSSENLAFAQANGILATPENIAAFRAEVDAYPRAGVIGPGLVNAQAVMELQTALTKLRYTVPVNGEYDQATFNAVESFKRTNGIHQNFKGPDGQYVVNGYAELSTQTLIKSQANSLTVASMPAPWDLPPAQRNYAAIAQQYGLYNTVENVDAFCNEMKAYPAEGALVPGSNQTQHISNLQGALNQLGYPVPMTGVYDAATMTAVTNFKVANGLRQSYRDVNGNFAVNAFTEAQTLNLLMQKLQAAATAQPAAQPQTAAPAQPAQPGQVDNATIAAQYQLLNTAENIQAFKNEALLYPTDGTLGPGSNDRQHITELQTLLQMWGYQVTPNGQYDAATEAAVLRFKTQNNLHQSYKAPDGNWAINQYADKQTLVFMSQKMQADMARKAA